MSLKLRLARIASVIEVAIERVFTGPDTPKVIEPYIGYATPEYLIVRGRVLASISSDVTEEGQSRLRNVRQMMRMFATDEVADVEVSAGGVSARSDEEGYFTLLLPRDTPLPGGAIEVAAGDVRARCPVQVPRPDASFGVISDIDDTMMETGAYSLLRNVWTSMTGNALTRRVYPDAVDLMSVLSDDARNPIFFVSSSPWNFHAFLQDVFSRNGLPTAPMFLRDYGISRTKFITGTHGDHKGSAIDTLLAAHPGLDFILVGDTGQHDAHVYADAANRHPGRIARVILHAPGSGVDAEDQRYIDRLAALGVPVSVGADYSSAIAELGDVIAA